MAEHAELKTGTYSPQLTRLLRLAEMEASRQDARGHVDVQVEHVLIAAMQDADPASGLFELMTKCGFSINQLRTGDFTPKLVPTAP